MQKYININAWGLKMLKLVDQISACWFCGRSPHGFSSYSCTICYLEMHKARLSFLLFLVFGNLLLVGFTA